MKEKSEVTTLLERWREGDRSAGDRVVTLVYDELRRIAGNVFRGERKDHTLQPTALAHEAYIRMVEGGAMEASSRTHFLALAGRVVRRVLIDYSRERGRQKRGGDQVRVELDDELVGEENEGPDLIDLDRVLASLEERDALAHQIVEMKFFSGLTIPEIAEALDISTATVIRKWQVARAWLHGALKPTSLDGVP